MLGLYTTAPHFKDTNSILTRPVNSWQVQSAELLQKDNARVLAFRFED